MAVVKGPIGAVWSPTEILEGLPLDFQTCGAMLRGLFQRKPKHERLEEEPEVRFKGSMVSERDLGYTYVRPGGKSVFDES